MTNNNLFFLVKDQNGGFHKVNRADILFVKSIGNYLQFTTNSGSITTYGSLQALQTVLEPDTRFMQVHRSFIANLEMATHLSSEALTINNQQVPIGRKFLDALRAGYIQAHLVIL